MGSRLDRLIALLDTGTTPSVRLTAARQLGQLAETRVSHPSSTDQLAREVKLEQDVSEVERGDGVWTGVDGEWNDVLQLVARVLPHLESRSSDTRQAAASALSHISRAVGIWDPASTAPPSSGGDVSTEESSVSLGRTHALESFDLVRVLTEGNLLLSSSGKEFTSNLSHLSAQELAQAQKEALGKLGLNFGGNGTDDIGVDVTAELAAGASTENRSRDSSTSARAPTPSSDLTSRTALPPPQFKAVPAAPQPTSAANAPSAPAPPQTDAGDPYEGLSARERNKLKRKRKAEGKAGAPASVPVSLPLAKKQKVDAAIPVKQEEGVDHLKVKKEDSEGLAEGKVVIDPGAKAKERAKLAAAGGGQIEVSEHGILPTSLSVTPGEWPWHTTVSRLAVGLVSPAWETRHGSALGLREVLKLQGRCGGMVEGVKKEENERSHEEWAGDLVAKLSCVLALDRFGDYVSDQVVAPVRETCAQVLAVLLPHISATSSSQALRILVAMVEQKHASPNSIKYAWQVRHSGLLGLKYFVAVKGELLRGAAAETGIERPEVKMEIKAEGEMSEAVDSESLLGSVVSAAVIGLRDRDDDVRSAAASTLIPLAETLIHRLPRSVEEIVEILWDCLGDLKDDLASSVGGVMDLLAKLLGFSEVIDFLQSSAVHTPLPRLIPRLFPFFRHTITSVRHSVLKTLLVFFDLPTLDASTWVNASVYRLLFQNLLLEQRAEIRLASQTAFSRCLALAERTPESLDRLVADVSPILSTWFSILRSPIGVPLNPALFWSARESLAGGGIGVVHNVDKPILNQDLALVSPEAILRGKVEASKAIGNLLSVWPAALIDTTFSLFLEQDLVANSALRRFLASTIVEEWAYSAPLDVSSPLMSRLVPTLQTSIAIDLPSNIVELQPILNRLRGDCTALYAAFSTQGKVPAAKLPSVPDFADFTISSARQVEASYSALLPHLSIKSTAKKTVLPQLEERYRKVESGIAYFETTKNKHDRMVSAALGGALIASRSIPSKITPLIRSVTNSIKTEDNLDLQSRSARAIAAFIDYCASPASTLRANPSDKLIKNLCTFLCQDVTRTPIFASAKTSEAGILTLEYEPARGTAPTAKELKEKQRLEESEENKTAKLVFRGAELALGELSLRFGDSLIERVPKLWSCMVDTALRVFASGNTVGADAQLDDDATGQDLIDSLTVLPVVARYLCPELRPRLSEVLPALALGTQSTFAVVRFAVAKCLATLCDIVPEQGMRQVIETVVPLIADPINVNHRRGAVEVISHIVELLDMKVLPYLIFLVVPVLGRMSDPDDDVRLVATNTFATLVKLVPLEAGLPDPPGFSADLLAKRESEREFLMQLLDGSKVAEYKIPVEIGIELRKYQRDGVSWLAFLARYQLHGLLCDDMGLGKTLQSICILASMHHERAERYRATKSPDAVHLPSLIICPPTLTGHWKQELNTYAKALRCVVYVGPRAERERLVKTFKNYDAVITSYDIARNDVDRLGSIEWHYCILDEGHIIKNGKTKLTKAIKSLRSIHRLILSGTPIQNNVLELWSLFDFLMPGFLGSEKAFNERFGKPIAASRDAKSSSREQEAGAAALAALHKQVLPFLLRRLKEDVLDDLPPKIIQDYYVELSPLQKKLYDDFSTSKIGDAVKGEVSTTSSDSKPQHVFQALQYLRKLVNHPVLVFKPEVPQHEAALDAVSVGTTPNIRNIQHAPKLTALRQILLDCGIGGDSTSDDGSGEEGVARHRVLIFCQLKQMLDIVEHDLFRDVMPSVTYMRLDGSTDVSKRFAVVQTFNADPSIDVLLLTTHVGGLGLNLTSADTVIFVEHDWNPMKDLQAMDRAHRLGQKRVVNVYRLIMRGTLEEKIMGLQRFKLNIASSVVTQQNSNLDSLGTDQILDLFQVSDTTPAPSSGAAASNDKPMSQKAILDSLSDLPADDEYGDLDVSAFTSSLA